MADDSDSSSNPTQSDYTDSEAEQNKEEDDGDLKTQTFEEILALKDRVGLRTYKSAIGLEEFGKKRKHKKVFKREDKNRPREMSSKVPVSGVRNIFSIKKKIRADPRFEEGFEEMQPRNKIKAEHKVKQKQKDYAFIEEIRNKEKKQLKKSLDEGTMELEERIKAKKILQKLQSREVSKKQKKLRSDIDNKYTAFLKNAKETGEQVMYMNKKDRKKAELVARFNELKKSGKLEKYLEKKRKKNAGRDGRKISAK